MLKDLDPLHSVAGQIAATNIAIEKAQKSIPPEDWLSIPYEKFCDAPATVYDEISRLLCAKESASDIPPYAGVRNFRNSNVWKLAEFSRPDAERAYETMYAEIRKSQSPEN